MDAIINCEIIARLSKVATANNLDNDRAYLRSIRLENINGNLIAIVTNVKLAAIEFIEKNKNPDFKMNIDVPDNLIQQCITETSFNSKIHFSLNEVLGFITAKTDLGYVHNSNLKINVPKDDAFEKWRDWFPDELPTETNGGIFSTLENLALLASTAPTGSVIFPEFMDNKKPVMLQDVHDPNWLGLFMPTPGSENRSPEPFNIPEWVR